MSLTWGAPSEGWPEFGPDGHKVQIDCRVHSQKVTWTTDPFSEEIGGVLVWGWICDDCLRESAMDI